MNKHQTSEVLSKSHQSDRDESGSLSSMKSRFLPAKRELPLVEPSGIHVFFQPAIEERLAGIKAITPSHLSFAERINRELERISSYYEAIGLWVHFEHRSVLLADKVGLTKDQYRDALAAAKMNSVLLFEDLLGRAEHAGLAPDLVAKTISEAQYIDPKPTARQRMLMMRTVMNSTPVVIADLFSRARVGSYGFGDGTTTQIFQGKTRIGDVAFSAIASPRLFQEKGAPESGYVFRFCMGKCELSGFEEDHPLYMLDTKVVESLTEWHRCCFPEQPLNQNPLLVAMARLLMVSTHDWGHSWLLYDRDAQTPEFQQWGNDIYTVPHVIQNKLLINYEVITASMHRYTWRLLFDNRPGLEPSIQSELQRYHEAVLDFAAFVEGKFGQERASQEENYLMYIPLSNLPCVLDWKTPAVNSLFERYPVVCEHVIDTGPFRATEPCVCAR